MRRARAGTAAPQRRSALARLRMLAVVSAMLVLLPGCSFGTPTGDAQSQARAFTFVAPGGQDRIFYDPPEQRGTVTGLSGESLLEPGRTIGLHDFPGQVVVLNIWGAWCGPCREEMPGLQQIHEQMRPSGVTLLGVDVRDNAEAARDFMRDRGITYPSIFDNPGRSLTALRGFPRNTVPSTIVLDREHRVAAIFLTALRVSELLPVVQRIAAEPVAVPLAGAVPQPGGAGTG
ncbi:TlpA disulfide reductase family protein [Pseudonocardia sp. MH-G8]|uniref:TlpA family protein disulfide reductase n=1 Tax=Pseudonocardia sp. MH-G8 TaxID=1854588 RepID=UPI000BA0AC8A|nr:TlpA disulfide reductase family protein [Pseudonocardia sp. MH-G8]OZM76541.1 alkyl hydroperoxide reductase [Pseudonocardia sp. MH-G8]